MSLRDLAISPWSAGGNIQTNLKKSLIKFYSTEKVVLISLGICFPVGFNESRQTKTQVGTRVNQILHIPPKDCRTQKA